MPKLTFEQLASMIGGSVEAGGNQSFDSVVIDSREAQPGALFFAIRGDRLDGHTFLVSALEKAEGAVVDEMPAELIPGKAYVRVDDTTVALQKLASEVRKQFPSTLIAVTGSAGKTTTKEMISTLVETERSTWKSWGNFNNQIGFPLCLANTPDRTEIVVSEMGMSSKGEIEFLARLSRPDIGVYTTIQPVHLEFFDSIDGIAAAKRELLENLADGGVVVLNADDARVIGIAEGFVGRKVTYGVDAAADYKADELNDRGLLGSQFMLRAEGESRPVTLSLPGRHNLENLLAAIATARVTGISWGGIDEGIQKLKPAYHRGVVIEWKGATLYDDTYNSNPYAVGKALTLLGQATDAARRIAVIGDMLELGPDELKYHQETGAAIPENVDVVIGVGPRSKSLVEGAANGGRSSDAIHHFADSEAAAAFLKEFIKPGDFVLLKGSRGIGLDRIITALQAGG